MFLPPNLGGLGRCFQGFRIPKLGKLDHVHAVYQRFLASTSDYQKSYNPKQYFLSPFKDPPTRQPYIEGLVPFAMAVSRITPLASSTLSSSLVELREGPYSLPLLSKVIHPSSASLSRRSRPYHKWFGVISCGWFREHYSNGYNHSPNIVMRAKPKSILLILTIYLH